MELHPLNQISAKAKEYVDLVDETIVSESMEEGEMENQVQNKVEREEVPLDSEVIHSSEAIVNNPNGEDEEDKQSFDHNGEDGENETDEESNDINFDDSSSKAKMTAMDSDIDDCDLVSAGPLIKYADYMRHKKKHQTIKGKPRKPIWTKNPLKAVMFSRTNSHRDHKENNLRR